MCAVYINAKIIPVETLPGIWTGGEEELWRE
jgi:hypothetical protein